MILSNALSPYHKLGAQDVEFLSDIDSISFSQFLYLPESELVVNPFPNHIVNLVQPLDSTSSPKGILKIKYEIYNGKFKECQLSPKRLCRIG